MRRAANWKRVGEIGPAGRKAGQDFPSCFSFKPRTRRRNMFLQSKHQLVWRWDVNYIFFINLFLYI